MPKAVLVACLCAALVMMVAQLTSAQLFDVPHDANKGDPCPFHYPFTICADCQVYCQGCAGYPGTYDSCVGFCHPTFGWAPGTQVQITYFPSGPFSSGGCTCSGYVCTPH